MALDLAVVFSPVLRVGHFSRDLLVYSCQAPKRRAPQFNADSLKPYSIRARMPVCFGIAKSISRFFRRPPSVNNPESCRKVSRPPEVSVPPEKQRFLRRKFRFGSLRRAHFLTRFKSSMEASTKPGEKNCKWMITGQIESKKFCQWALKASRPERRTRVATAGWAEFPG